MSVGIIAQAGPDRSSTHPRSEPVTRGGTRMALAAMLGVGAATHLIVGVQHSQANFGHLSVLAAVAQSAFAVMVVVRPSRLAFRGAVILSLVLFQAYLLNVTVGLPPVIAHSHVAGTHELWGLTLAWPGPIDGEGVVARMAEAGTVVIAVLLERGGSAWRRSPSADQRSATR